MSAVTKLPGIEPEREVQLRQLARSLKAGSTSVSVGDTSSFNAALGTTWKKYAPLGYMLPWEVLDYVELLAQFNPDYSQAVDNIRTLANSGHKLFVDGPVRVARRTKDRLEEKARTIQTQHGGMDGLIDKLLKQAAVHGAMCGEWILNEEMSDVIDFADVNPKSIRFFWEEEHWAPYQKVSAAQAKEAERAGQKVRDGNCIKLNEFTFAYFAFDAAPSSPYGTPPFVSALQPIAVQQDMVANLSQIVKKVGLLGIIDMTVKGLPRTNGESDAAYQARAETYLDAYVDVVEQMVQDGGVVHFDDVDVTTYNISGNAAGATAIFKQNEELVFSGLKSMPSVQGRSYSTTETYAGVAYDIIIRNTIKYQRGCKRMIERGYWLMCAVWGENPKGIRLEFNSNKTLHRLQEAQAEALEIRNGAMLWQAGLIDQLGYGQRLGYSEPKRPMELPPLEIIGGAARVASDEENAGNEASSDKSLVIQGNPEQHQA